MKKPKLVILRGRPTSGKTTALASLRKRKELQDYLIIDFSALKGNFDNQGDKRKEYAKRSLFALLKEIMPDQKDILLDEMSRDTIMKYIGRHVKKYNYQIVVFQFYVDTETAYKRDVQRSKAGEHPYLGKKKVKEFHDMHDRDSDPEGITVDCNKLSRKGVVDFIVRNLKK
jgi:predicted ABC-type ATPase